MSTIEEVISTATQKAATAGLIAATVASDEGHRSLQHAVRLLVADHRADSAETLRVLVELGEHYIAVDQDTPADVEDARYRPQHPNAHRNTEAFTKHPGSPS